MKGGDIIHTLNHTLIIHTDADICPISATEVFNAIKAEGNVHTEIDGASFVITGLDVHLWKILNRVSGGRHDYFLFQPPTTLLRHFE